MDTKHLAAATIMFSVAFGACLGAPDAAQQGSADESTFREVNTERSTRAFRDYIAKGLRKLAETDNDIARSTLEAINAGYVQVDEFADFTCADFERVIKDFPKHNLSLADFSSLTSRSAIIKRLEDEMYGYMWSDRIYVARGLSAEKLAATLVHEVNHVINRSETGYYDNLPVSAFLHEYRAFYAERQVYPDPNQERDLVKFILETYELDRDKMPADVLANPLTPILLADQAAWLQRAPWNDVETSTASCQ